LKIKRNEGIISTGMRTYFGINRKFASNAFKLMVDYDLDEVGDTLALMRSQPTPKDFLDKFEYTCRQSPVLEDMLGHSLGWLILSERLADVVRQCSNFQDVELHYLPEKVWPLHPSLEQYRVLSVKKEVKCVDEEKSDILWSSGSSGSRYINSFRECILKESCIPDDLDMFRIEEYPVMVVISSRMAMKFAELYPTGFVFEKITAV